MKLLHTSDWHLGRALYGHKRTDEFTHFLNWLANVIREEQVELLCIAGDIFDSTTPSNKAQNLYYGFLQKIIAQGCNHVIITAGNHDSPTLLEAPKDLLKAMNIHVIGCLPTALEDEVILISDRDDTPQLIVCAVPYLRDRDIRKAREGESIDDKSHNLILGIEEHYKQVVQLAERQRLALKARVPLVAMGHLFTTGGLTVEGDGVRELYVGSLAHVSDRAFSTEIDYLALGHLHSQQRVAGSDTRRYSGSPIPMSFAEANKEKQVLLVDLACDRTMVNALPVPCFQKLTSLKGDLTSLLEQVEELKSTAEGIWLEIIYQGDEIAGTLQKDLYQATQGTNIEILRIVNTKILSQALKQSDSTETLENLSVSDVFERCLLQNNIQEQQKIELTSRFQETLQALQENDDNAG